MADELGRTREDDEMVCRGWKMGLRWGKNGAVPWLWRRTTGEEARTSDEPICKGEGSGRAMIVVVVVMVEGGGGSAGGRKGRQAL